MANIKFYIKDLFNKFGFLEKLNQLSNNIGTGGGGTSYTAGDNISISSDNTISAEGYTYTKSNDSFSVGEKTISLGHKSSSFGSETASIGMSSMSIGDHTSSIGPYSYSCGKGYQYSINVTSFDVTSKTINYSTIDFTPVIGQVLGNTNYKGNYAKIVGVTSGSIVIDKDLSVIFSSLSVGKKYIYLLTSSSGPCSHSEGYSTSASGNASHSEGRNTVSDGNYSHAEGNGSIASGYCSHAEGHQTKASGSYSHAEGLNTNASGGFCSHAEGNQTTASGENSHAEGNGSIASGYGAHSEGVAIASGKYSHAEGSNELPVWRRFRIKTWVTNIVFYIKNISLKGSNGTEYITNGSCTTYIPAMNGKFINYTTTVSSITSTTHTAGTQTLLITTDPLNSAQKCLKVTNTGSSQTIFEFMDTALNFLPKQNYTFKCDMYIPNGSSIPLDYSGNGLGLYGWNGENFLGQFTNCTQTGKWVTITLSVPVANLIAEAAGVGSHIEGVGGYALGNGSHVEGIFGYNNGTASHTEGTSSILNASCAHAEGYRTLVYGHNGHSEGSITWSDGDSSHSEGIGSICIGHASHTEGYYTLVPGNMGHSCHAEGYMTCAGNNHSHSEGYARYDDYSELIINSISGATITFSTTSHGLVAGNVYRVSPIRSIWWVGKSHIYDDIKTSKKSGYYPQDVYSVVSVSGATVTMNKSISSELKPGNKYGFTLIYGSATGIASHSEGYACNVIGDYSHVEGYCNVANSECQHVQGKYNEIDGKKELVDIIGWGTEEKRRNIEVTRNDGTKWLANDVTCGGGSYTSCLHKLSEKITMPEGGSNGQYLQKFDDGVRWATVSGGGGGGYTEDQIKQIIWQYLEDMGIKLGDGYASPGVIQTNQMVQANQSIYYGG